MLVLAIAGLILSIIFLAVPAFRRANYNHSRSSDAAHLIGLVNEYESTHFGQLPLQYGNGANQLDLSNEQWAIVNPPESNTINTGAAPIYGDLDNVIINEGYRCTNGVLQQIGGNIFAVGFSVESSSGSQNTCIQG